MTKLDLFWMSNKEWIEVDAKRREALRQSIPVQ